ncbi:fibrinogen C domain-containing protein 1-like [Haliotis cracherodii]|uniref:fibrinogen C domain-containing protein 1-like n=1 Tax=Haliotis cracherodii TaxID=6455 RepID=UPI0039ED4541
MANCAASSTCEATNVLFAQRHCSYFTGDEYDNLSDFEDVMYEKAYPPPPECQNGGVWSDTTKTSCDCTGSFAGTYCERYWDDCSEGFKMGIRTDGVYTIQPRPFATPFQVYCDMTFGGRTYVQKQSLGIDFYRTWQEYRDGFGTPGGDYWLGLEKMKAISDKTPGRLVINMLYKTGQPTWGQIICHSFKLTDELDGFRLNFSRTTASKTNGINDVITDLRGARFSTKDRDNDEDPAGSCSQKHHSGWWFRNCTLCNPNGQLKPIPNIATDPDDIFWDGDSRGVKEIYIALSGY